MKTVEQIVNEYTMRRAQRDPVIEQMRRVSQHYAGEWIVQLPEMDTATKPAVANLLHTGIEQTAQRIASTLPNLYYPPVRPNIQRSIDLANVRRKANLGWWEASTLNLKLRRRARHLVAYSAAPVMIRPDMDHDIPRWHVRDPLSAYPADTGDADDMTPTDCIFAFTRSVGYVRSTWPDQYATLRRNKNAMDTDQITLLEYCDHEQWTLLAMGDSTLPSNEQLPYGGYQTNSNIVGYQPNILLDTTINRADVCPVIIPGRITLGAPQGQFDQTMPLYSAQARLQALEVIATEKAIFKDAYLIGRPNENPKFVAGPFDGRTGQVNIVEGGTIEYIGGEPNPQTNQTIDRLERNQRVMSGVAAEMGGESTADVRTGRRGDAILSTQIDPGVQEAQEVLQISLQHENRIAVAIAKTYFGRNPKSFYVTWNSKSEGATDYLPDRDFENDHNIVTYPHAGADQASLTIGLGQRLGEGLISKQTARDLDPMIADSQREKDWVEKEQIETALLQGFLQQVTAGSITIADAARVMQLVQSNSKQLADAILDVQSEAQTRQAADQTAPPGSPAAPVDPNSPAAQPGLSQPGMGAEAGTPAIPPPGPSAVNLQQMLQTLRRPNNLSPAERGAA